MKSKCSAGSKTNGEKANVKLEERFINSSTKRKWEPETEDAG